MILDQSTQKGLNRNYKRFSTNLEIPGGNAYMNRQQKKLLKYIISYNINSDLIKNASRRVQVSRKYLGTRKLILRGKYDVTSILKSILRNIKCARYNLNRNWYNVLNGVRKKSEIKKLKQLQITYFQNSHKYIDARPPLACITIQTNMLLEAEEAHAKKSQESLGAIVFGLVKQKIRRGRRFTETRMLQKKLYKNMYRILAYVKEREFSKKNKNIYNKYQYNMFTDVENPLNAERKVQHMGFKKYGQLSKTFQQKSSFLLREKIKVQKKKTITKKYVNEHKFLFTDAFTHKSGSDSVQKIFPAHNTVLSNTEKKQFVFKSKKYRNKKLITKQANVLGSKKESKSGGNGIDRSSKMYYMLPPIINPIFPSITSIISVGCEMLSSEVYQAKSSVYMMEMLKHLMQTSQSVKNKFVSVAQKGFRLSSLKTFMARKHCDAEDSLSILLHLHKRIIQRPSVGERTKRSVKEEKVSAKGENIPVSVDFLLRVSSALVAGATIFGIALFALALAACYLYFNRRQLGEFIDVVLKGAESQNGAKTTDSQGCTPISLSQNFHFGQPQESSRNQTPLATVTEAFSKGRSDTVTVKEICCSSDTEGSLNTPYKGLTVRSRAYVLASRSSESIRSFCDDTYDVSSAQFSSADEIMENELSNQCNSKPKEKVSIPVAHQPKHSSCRQGPSTSRDVLSPLKELKISRSKSENDIITSFSGKELHAVSSATFSE
ncbi:uncharacterized protein LOC128323553 isoform X2 [Hemicordylus capensis]|nr:uncharacterized protein LOC128323553 isoform X2 [Hemicordylus capensis]XP_053102866.1 uncharacterized protein LOC128323553 isoform X2 [Hemicordylus capensis]